jgi:thiamine biosynthesis protein ThiI
MVAPDLEAIAERALAAARAARESRGRPPAFKIEARRSDKRFPLTSLELARVVGGRVHEGAGLPVDVHAPELVIGIELAAAHAFVFAETVAGPGGLPVGTAGRVAALVSGGIDSPVAAWLAAKRGCDVRGVYFHSFPYTGDRTREKVLAACRQVARWHGPLDLWVVPFTAVQKALRAAGPAELAVVLYRRSMMRIAGRIARREGAQALVTGENLGQVASQTLENLAVIEQAATLPVLRPLLTYDKLETVALAERIGSYAISIQPYEDCCSLFVPRHPATRARLGPVQAVEGALAELAVLEEVAAEQAERCVAEPAP